MGDGMLRKKTRWQELRRTEFASLAVQEAVVVIPVASIEQHGEHLPLDTDANNCLSIALGAAERIEDFRVLVLPVVAPGYSPHHMAYSGTLSLVFETFVRVLTEIGVCVHAHGFKKILYLNGHGGNSAIVSAMRLKLAAEHSISAVGYTYWDLPGVGEVWRAVSETDAGFVGHAGEVETSLQLYLQPELVEMDEARWVPGMYGDPTRATREKGARFFDAAVRGLMQVATELHSGALEKRLEWSGVDVPLER
jgi:creatinine amidohydrolase